MKNYLCFLLLFSLPVCHASLTACDSFNKNCVDLGFTSNTPYLGCMEMLKGRWTDDGGTSWNDSYMSDPFVGNTCENMLYLKGISCSDDGFNCSVVMTGLSAAYVMFTTDAGKGWFTTADDYSTPLFYQVDLNSVQCDVSGLLCNAIGKDDYYVDTRTFSSLDGGKNWSANNTIFP